MAELNTIERALTVKGKEIQAGDLVWLGTDGHIVAGSAATKHHSGLTGIHAIDGRREIIYVESEDNFKVVRDEFDVRPTTVVAVLTATTTLAIESGPIVRLKDGWYDQDGDKIADADQDGLINQIIVLGAATIAYEPEV